MSEDVRPNKAREEIDPGEAHGMVMVPKVPRLLDVVVVVRFLGPCHALVFEPCREPGVRISVALGLVYAAVEVDNRWDALMRRNGGRDCWVPRQDVLGWEVVLPRYTCLDSL